MKNRRLPECCIRCNVRTVTAQRANQCLRKRVQPFKKRKKSCFLDFQKKRKKVKQESLAIAKTTARCAQYMGALKSFERPRKRPGYFSRNL